MDDRNHLAPLCAVSLALALLCSTAVHSETLTAGDLRLDISEQARVTGISIADTKLKITPGPLLTLCDVSLGKFHEPSEAAGDLQHGLELRFNSLRATVVLSALAAGGALHLNCGIVGDPGPARGMLLRFALPIDAVGWQWYRDIQDADRIAEGRRYEFIEPLRAWADLPEWKDQADLRMGYSNRNFCTVIAGPVGLCLALPIDKPCLARTAYDASRRSLEVVYDFALSPDARMAHEAEFAFDLYTCDPQWGFRSALARYYELYPDLFEVCVKDPGPWMAFSRLSEIDNANEFCFRIQEGAPEPAYDDKLGVLSTVYFTHAGMGANLPEHDPEKDPSRRTTSRSRRWKKRSSSGPESTGCFRKSDSSTPKANSTSARGESTPTSSRSSISIPISPTASGP